MKTVELKWIEDDNHTVAKDACDTLQGLVDSGAFPDLGVKCEDDTLYITGEKEVLDRAVMKIQKAFAKYGQIMMKEAKNGTTEELRIEYNPWRERAVQPCTVLSCLNEGRYETVPFLCRSLPDGIDGRVGLFQGICFSRNGGCFRGVGRSVCPNRFDGADNH
jgi:hypothetical protein